MARSSAPGTSCLAAVALAAPTALADPGQPVAVRVWPGGAASLETYWNLRVAIAPAGATDLSAAGLAGLDLLVVPAGPDETAGADRARFVLAAAPGLDRVLDRPPNRDGPELLAADLAATATSHALRVRAAAGGAVSIEVDGIRVLHVPDPGAVDPAALAAAGPVDVLLVPLGDRERLLAIVKRVHPRIVLPIDGTRIEDARALRGGLPPAYGAREVTGNTIAVRPVGPTESVQPMILVAQREPWPLPEELAALFEAKERACRDAQPVFEPLSVRQMNHRPSNGTHTPRWNVEHMMGRELGFFSAIYSNVDPMVAHIDLNPAQMPADYVPRHPDWNGREEARQMERVQAFTRRFAYLLEGVRPGELPPGAPPFAGSLRGLLKIMARHYGAHTANVKAKFELPDWPE